MISVPDFRRSCLVWPERLLLLLQGSPPGRRRRGRLDNHPHGKKLAGRCAPTHLPFGCRLPLFY